MPPFPGMGYPLVPGYESVGRIVAAGPDHRSPHRRDVFVPGATCYGEIRGLFGGASSRIVLPSARAMTIDPALGEKGVLMALAATAQHAIAGPVLPDLIVGHGVVGRLVARLVLAAGGAPPVVWETNPQRTGGATGYEVSIPTTDTRRGYRCICDASGDSEPAGHADHAPRRRWRNRSRRILRRSAVVRFPDGVHEARRGSASPRNGSRPIWRRCGELIANGSLSLDGLITHRMDATQADQAYRTAFGDLDLPENDSRLEERMS